MKIICDKNEFAALVRACQHGSQYKGCTGCVFSGVCANNREELYDGEIMSRIEDICYMEVEVDLHG